MDGLVLPGVTEQLPTADAKALQNAQNGPLEDVALPVFAALLAMAQSADVTAATEAETLALRQALAAEGKNLPPATLPPETLPVPLLPPAPHLLPAEEVTHPQTQTLAEDVLAQTPATTHPAVVKPGSLARSADLVQEFPAPEMPRPSIQPVEHAPLARARISSLEAAPMAPLPPTSVTPAASGTMTPGATPVPAVTTELAVEDTPHANTPLATRVSTDGLASSIAAPASTTAAEHAMVSGPRPTTLALPSRLDSPEWGEAFASRVAWAANSNVQVAELRLNPPQLGHIGVHIAIQNNKADIAFATPHAEVLATIESALPRLRELFGESGVSLGSVDVSQHGSNATPGRDHNAHPQSKFFAMPETTTETEQQPLTLVSKGLVDHYV